MLAKADLEKVQVRAPAIPQKHGLGSMGTTKDVSGLLGRINAGADAYSGMESSAPPRNIHHTQTLAAKKYSMTSPVNIVQNSTPKKEAKPQEQDTAQKLSPLKRMLAGMNMSPPKPKKPEAGLFKEEPRHTEPSNRSQQIDTDMAKEVAALKAQMAEKDKTIASQAEWLKKL